MGKKKTSAKTKTRTSAKPKAKTETKKEAKPKANRKSDAPARRVFVSPSVLAIDYGHAAEEIRKAERLGADAFHFDVMDGHFVPNISFGPDFVRDLRKASKKPFTVHLMISEPQRYWKEFAKHLRNGDCIEFHVEALAEEGETNKLLSEIRGFGMKAGIAIDLETPVEKALPFVQFCDEILVMSVKAGFGGQSFHLGAIEKIRKLREAIDALPRGSKRP
ncbi:MAG: ribulose-phosphate 3-epimerase, partial [Candidatus Micrarchaeota archaeon]